MWTTQMAGAASVFALVAYIPGSLGEFLDALRESFPGHRGGRAHLTFLPPRPLHITQEVAAPLLSKALSNFQPFEVELTDVLRFPITDVLYIGIGEGSMQAHRLHEILNQGSFAADEAFEYRPHITLALPPAGADVETWQRRATDCWHRYPNAKRFPVNQLDFLQQLPDGTWEKRWQTVLRKAA
jgi:2'-5' RNA ligase